MNGDEWIAFVYYEWGYTDSTRILFIQIHPHSDDWVKLNPHSSPFPIHPRDTDNDNGDETADTEI